MGEKEAANSDGSGAGALMWLEPHSRVDRTSCPEAVGPGSSPDGDTLSPDTTSRKSVPKRAQQRVVTPAGQNHRDDSDRQVGEKNGGRKKAGQY